MIFGPIAQVGCASASAGVTSSSSARERPRNGPPEAVRTRPDDASRDRVPRGTGRAPSARCRPAAAARRRARCAASGELAGGDEALLVRERERDAVLERPERRVDAGEADDRVEDDVRLAALEQLGRVAADLDVLDAVLRRELVERRASRDWSAQSSSSGCAATISIAWRPIEPVAPSSATRLTAAKHA